MGNFFARNTPAPVTGSATQQVAKPSAYGVRRALVASARTIDPNKAAEAKTLTYRAWQKDAWRGYDSVGEIHQGFGLQADTFSRIRVYPGAITDSSEVPIGVKEALNLKTETGLPAPIISKELADKCTELMDALVRNDFSSQSRTFALNMSVVGECLLVELPAGTNLDEGRPGDWVIRSTDELVVTADNITMYPSSSEANKHSGVVLATKKNNVWDRTIPIGRIWRQHPRYTDEPDSSMKALSEPVEELMLVSRLIRTTTRAQLNAGMLFIPDGITALSENSGSAETVLDENGIPVDDPAVVDPGNVIVSEIFDTISRPVLDEDSTSSIMPSVLVGEGALGAMIRHITFDRKTDEWLSGRGERALERIMQGIDIPKDMVTGLANVKYANAVVIDENFWKTSIEPMAMMFSDALTDVYLRPKLIEAGFDKKEVDKVCVWYDPSDIVTEADQSDDATIGYEKHLISGAAWRRVHGFSDADAPDEDEIALQLLFTKSTIAEDVTAAFLKNALPKMMKEQRDANVEGSVPDSAEQLLNPTAEPAAPEAG